jgi:hypothetical protein
LQANDDDNATLQAYDRLHRIGQTREVSTTTTTITTTITTPQVHIHRLIAHDTVEERMLRMQTSKQHLASRVRYRISAMFLQYVTLSTGCTGQCQWLLHVAAKDDDAAAAAGVEAMRCRCRCCCCFCSRIQYLYMGLCSISQWDAVSLSVTPCCVSHIITQSFNQFTVIITENYY